jgi:hypothetical protein
LTVAVALSVTGLIGTAVPSLAECGRQVNPFPDFSDVAPSADTVVIGTVIESHRDDPTEPTASFTLQVDDVVRGDPPATLTFDLLRSGLPLRGPQSCRGDATLFVHVEDVIALALHGRLGDRGSVNTAAWIEGRPERDLVPGVEVMNRREAIAAARVLPPTDAVAASPATAGLSAALIDLLTASAAGVYTGVRQSDS